MDKNEELSSAEKLVIVMQAVALSGNELEQFLQTRGLSEAELRTWHAQMLAGLEPSLARQVVALCIGDLGKEDCREGRILQQTAALHALRKRA